MERRDFLMGSVGVTLSALLLEGCGGGGGGEGAAAPPGNSDNPPGSVTGFLFRDVGGKTILGTSAAAPAGATPLAGAALQIVGSSLKSQSGSDGGFTLAGIPAGLQQLFIDGGTRAVTTIALTIIGGATINIGETSVSRQAAKSLVLQALLNAGVAIPANVQILAPQHPLPAGVLVVPRMDAATIDKTVPGARTIASSSWFFYTDEAAGQPLSHPLRYFYVDAATGALSMEDRTSCRLSTRSTSIPLPLRPLARRT